MHCVWGSDGIGLGTLTRLFLVQRFLTDGEFGENEELDHKLHLPFLVFDCSILHFEELKDFKIDL